jgi:hypothetical protein
MGQNIWRADLFSFERKSGFVNVIEMVQGIYAIYATCYIGYRLHATVYRVYNVECRVKRVKSVKSV